MKKSFCKTWLWLVSLALIVTSCNRQTALVPPEIHYGADVCADCGMIISDSHYAAALAWRGPSDDAIQTAAFDDIGCLLEWRRHHTGAQIVAAWVKNVHTGAWLAAASAVYAKDPRLHTPMGSGVAAGEVNDFPEASTQLPTLTWADLLNAGESQADNAPIANMNK